MSRALARASAVVGTELLVRDGRGVRLTPAARTLLPYVEQALAEFQAGLDLVRNESAVVRGKNLGVLPAHLRRGNPAAADQCLPRPAPGRQLADIRTEPFVALGPGYGLRSLTDALFREAGYRPRIAFESQDSHTVRGLVSAGLGVSVLPPGGNAPGRTAGPETGDLGLVEIPLDSPLAFREVGLSWRRRKPGSEPVPVRLFREMVVTEGPELLAGLVRQRSL